MKKLNVKKYNKGRKSSTYKASEVKLVSHVQLFAICPRNSPDKNTGVGCHFLLQGIFPTQGLNPGLPHCRQLL